MDINKAIESMWAIVKPQIATTIRGGFKVVAGMIGGWGALKNPGSQEQFIDLGTALVLYLIGQGWSWWQASGQDFVKAQFEVIQAKTLAQAQKLRTAGIPQVTVKEIAQQSPTMTLAETAKVIPTLPAEIQANISPTSAAKIVAVLAIMIIAMFAGLDPASAQIKLKPLTGNIGNDLGITSPSGKSNALDSIATVLAKPFQDIANFIGEDADGAVALATAIPNLQDGHGQQCWIAMQSFGAIIKAHPIPITFHVINDYESLRLLGIATNNLCSNVHCTQVFADFSAMAVAASPMPLAIPSLHDLCTKVPQIAVVPPITLTDTTKGITTAAPAPTPETAPATSPTPAKP
jgi:hypothetical protein